MQHTRQMASLLTYLWSLVVYTALFITVQSAICHSTVKTVAVSFVCRTFSVLEMRGLLSTLLLLAIVSVCQGEVGQVCTSKDQCAADECCEIINIVVASRKRQALLQPIRPVSESGTCKKYQEKGTYCQSFDVLNGFCGCGQGLTCQSVNIGTPLPPVLDSPSRRSLRPGFASYCLEP